MTRLILAGVLVCALPAFAFAQSNLYKMRNGTIITPPANELVETAKRMRKDFETLASHFSAMTQQRDAVGDFTTVMKQYGVIDPATDNPCEPCAEALYNELNAMVGNGGPSVRQLTDRVYQ